MVQEGRDGAEKGRALGERTEERKEKREGKDNHNQDERAAEGNSSVQAWCRKGSRHEVAMPRCRVAPPVPCPRANIIRGVYQPTDAL